VKTFAKSALGVGALALGVLLVVRPGKLASLGRKPVDSSALVQALASANQPKAVVSTVQQAAAAGDPCHYAEVAVRAALDADLHELTRSLIAAAPPDCQKGAPLLGAQAEALARGEESERAEAEALNAIKVNPSNPFAELALSRLAYDKNQMTACADYADKALKFGRGAEADRLLGRSALARGKFDEAAAHFNKVLSANPNDAEAAFSAAVCNDKLGHYYQAREGFLQTLHIDPKHEQARIYLVVLTHNAGANAESRHHLAKLAEIMPKDSPKLQELQALLDSTTPDGGAPDAGAPKAVPGMVQGKR
jgi:tetratricopeptide (TPR) repeat protein